MEDLTNKQLKDIIRSYKKEKCPAFSKEKKEGLIKIVKSLGLDITLTPIKKKKKKENIKLKIKDKKPDPPPKPPKPILDEPLIDDDVPKIKKIQSIKEPKFIKGITLTPDKIEKFKIRGNDSWNASQTNMLIVYEYILDKHKNDCIPIVKSIDGKEAILTIEIRNAEKDMEKSDIDFAWTKKGRGYNKPASEEDLMKAVKKLRECKKRFVPLPFGFSYNDGIGTSAHANMIILDLEKNTAEHLEPHGNEYRGESYKLKGLDQTINKLLPEIFEEWGFKYSNPNESCPYIKGVQSIEGYNRKGDDINRNVELDVFDKFTKEQNGLCALWSFILFDLRLSNPDFTIQEILKNVLKDIDFEEFKTNVLEDFSKSYKSYDPDSINYKDYEQYASQLFVKWKKKKDMKLSDLFFMYAITLAHEAFGNYTNDLLNAMKDEAEKNDMKNFMKFIEDNKINPFKLMWIFGKVDNKKIELKTNDYVVENPNGLFTTAFYNNVSPKVRKIVFNKLLDKTTINVLKETREKKKNLKKQLQEKGAINIKTTSQGELGKLENEDQLVKQYIEKIARGYWGTKTKKKELERPLLEAIKKKLIDKGMEHSSKTPGVPEEYFNKNMKPLANLVNDYMKSKKKKIYDDELKIYNKFYDTGLESEMTLYLKNEQKKKVMKKVNKKEGLSEKLKDELDDLIGKKTFEEIEAYQFNMENKFVKSVIKMYPAYKDILKNNSESSENTLIVFLDYVAENYDSDDMIKIYRKFIKKLKE